MYFDGLSELKSKIKSMGGMVNSHSHLDRAFTVFEKKDYDGAVESHLFEKWKLVNKVKENSSQKDYEDRITSACLSQMRMGVEHVCLSSMLIQSLNIELVLLH